MKAFKHALKVLLYCVLNYALIAFITWDWGLNWAISAWIVFGAMCCFSIFVYFFYGIMQDVDDEIDRQYL